MSSPKVAIVTGANKGIGFYVVKGICENFDGIVYLTSRDVERGKAAVSQLEREYNLKAKFHQLDISEQASIDKFRDYIKQEHGGLDLLINNAAIAFKNKAPEPFYVQAKETIRINYYGTLNLCEALFPLLRNNAKVVNLSSSAGHLTRIPSEHIRKEFSRKDITIPELNKLMERFIQAAENNRASEEGWGSSAYSVSKVGVTALTNIQQKMFDEEIPYRNVSVNAVHPGYVRTDMSSQNGNLSPEEGAKSTLFTALDSNLKGQYIWHDCRVVDWFSDSVPSS